MSTVSVIIPAYNCERYIAETVDSVLAQTYRDLELIVVDDGSTDRTREILEGYGSRLRVLSQANAGVCAARNHGIREARGDFICLMDHDDWWFSDKVERQTAALRADPGLGVVYSSFLLWSPDERGEFPPPASFGRTGDPARTDPQLSGWIYHQFLIDCWMLTSTAMFRAAVFSDCGMFDEGLPYSEDWELWIRMSRRHRFLKFEQPTTLYRQHPQQGNRRVRPVDYRTELLRSSVQRWGLASPDGRSITPGEFSRQLARYHVEYGFSQLGAGQLRRGFGALAKACATRPTQLKYTGYMLAALCGWRPRW